MDPYAGTAEANEKLSKSKALGVWVIDANGERVEWGPQSIFSPVLSASALTMRIPLRKQLGVNLESPGAIALDLRELASH
jgi:hypothetical protein